MMPEIQFLLGVFLLSSMVSYAWWVRFRVWMLRQDLFEIRDQLWIEMVEAGLVDHPDHRQLREVLNGAIRFAPRFSVFSVARILDRNPRVAFIPNKESPEAVKQAFGRLMTCLGTYLIFHTMAGWVAIVTLSILGFGVMFPLETLRSLAAKAATKAINSLEVQSESRPVAERYIAGGV